MSRADRDATVTREEAPPSGRGAGPGVALVAVAVAVVALAAVTWWGRALADDGVRLYLDAPPFVGRWRWLWTPALWWAVVMAVALVVWWVPAVERLRWGPVLFGSWCWALLWPAVLQWSEGWESLATVLADRRAYLPTARSIESPIDFLATYVERLPSFPTHVKGHPPGATLAHWFVDLVGGGRSDVLAATFLGVAALAAPASLVALDRLAGRASARRAAGFAGLAPAAMWIATSPDAMFMGVVACSVALGAIAATSVGRRAGPAAAVGAGLLAGVSLSFSYGAVLLLAPLWAVGLLALRRGALARAALAVVGLAVVPLVFAAAGFDWSDGLEATRAEYLAGVAPERPDRYFVVANLVVFAVAIGPATVAGVARLRDRAAWWLVGGGMVGVLAADLSGMSKGEVERIWLPAVPFVVLATAALGGPTARRGWLAAQLAVGLLLTAALDSPW